MKQNREIQSTLLSYFSIFYYGFVGNLSERNYELICNLGLQNLLTISKDQAAASKTFDALKNQEVSDAKNILKAHENLTAADQENVGKFQDVIAFLRNQVDKQEKQV